eukprot:3245269-Prymnesium_polylepis.1
MPNTFSKGKRLLATIGDPNGAGTQMAQRPVLRQAVPRSSAHVPCAGATACPPAMPTRPPPVR